ncbi:MAG: branched-chain amino acid ABC transporter permease [Chloroflexota bacterium]
MNVSLSRQKAFYLTILFVSFVFPFIVTDRYVLSLVILSGVFAVATMSFNLILGYTGQASLAHGGFMGIGAYGVALMTMNGVSFWLALPASALIAALIGFVIGLPTLRSRGAYFAITTLCFGVIVYLVAGSWIDVTGGYTGLVGIPAPSPIAIPFIGEITFTSLTSQYYLVLVTALFTLFVMYRIVHSLLGYTFMAIRNSETLASSVGINTFTNKLLSFVIANFFAGLSGGLYAVIMGSISPSAATYNTTFILLIYLLLGGAASMAGPIIGAFVIPLIMEYLQAISDYRLLVFGALLIAVIIYCPRGLVGAGDSLRQKAREYYAARKAGERVATASRKAD